MRSISRFPARRLTAHPGMTAWRLTAPARS
jgi:hypothetical protein